MPNIVLILLCAVLFIIVIFMTVRYMRIRDRFAVVVDIDAEVSKVQSQLKNEIANFERTVVANAKQSTKLAEEYSISKKIYDRLVAQVAVLEETLEGVSFGLYRPHFTFEDPENFKKEIDRIYKVKRRLVKENRAMTAPVGWTVNGNAREGVKMVKQECKLMMRAFNGEVDAAVAKVSWNNVLKMEERIRKAYDAVNELGSVMQIRINKEYLDLSISELRLSHELEQRKQEIKEEQREIREQMRQEEIAQREFEKARKNAEAEESRYRKALEVAREEMARATATQVEAAANKIQLLEGRLAEAEKNVARAVSMAQLTKSGHVYVISNVGSFGDDVFKIGMSRRLDPSERVYELGSASVPFPYDIHAMIYSDNAPGLENAFHKEFSQRRVNMVNTRKEFFRVDIAEIETFVRTHHAEIEFTKLAEAKEYRETLSLLSNLQSNLQDARLENSQNDFPSDLGPVMVS